MRLAVPTFADIETVNNPTSIHGMYPYRGKIAAVEAAQVVAQLTKGATLLDPFCGSGTILLEAGRQGLTVSGTDLNPTALWLSRAKLGCIEPLESYLTEVNSIIAIAESHMGEAVLEAPEWGHFHTQTAYQIAAIAREFEQMSDYVRGCFLGAVALTARACNHYMWTSSTVGKNIEPKLYVDFRLKFAAKVKKHYSLNTNPAYMVTAADARELPQVFAEGKFDYVLTSPPYFDALDYTAYYSKIIYGILGVDRQIVRKDLIQTARKYEEDMRTVMEGILRVTHSSSIIVFVVGDKKTAHGVVNGGEFFSELLHHRPNHVHERGYTKSSSQVFDAINRTSRKEQIVMWDRSTW